MKSVKIIAVNNKGKMALEHHVFESLKASKKNKLMFKMLGYSQEVISDNPYTLELSLRQKTFQVLVKCEDICKKIEEALNENGAIRGRDYILEGKE